MFQLLKCADYLCTFTFQGVITFDLSKGAEYVQLVNILSLETRIGTW